MTPRVYLRAALGLALLLGGGVGLGLWASSSGARPDPGAIPDLVVADPARVRFAVVGDIGDDTGVARQVREAVGRVCRARGCDAILLLGDNLYPEGMTAPDDPRAAELFADPWAAVGPPVLAILGDRDYGHVLDRRRAAWQVGLAARTPTLELPSPTWTATAGPVGLWGLDTTEIALTGGAAQGAWIEHTARTSTARWRIALGHHPFVSNGPRGNAGAYGGAEGVPAVDGAALARFYEDRACGRFDLLLTADDPSLQWIERCGMAVIVSGAGAGGRPTVDRGNRTVFERGQAGFVWLSLADAGATIAFYDDIGELSFEALRARDGALSRVRVSEAEPSVEP